MIRAPFKRILTFALAAVLFAQLPAFADSDLPFAISFDGKKVDSSADVRRVEKMEAADLEGVDIQVKFDGLGVRPVLNVSTYPAQVNFRTGDKVKFLASFNYAAWITKAEVRIYKAGDVQSGQPLAVVEVASDSSALWVMPENAPNDMQYVLRVYDKDKRFDETLSLIHI